MTSSFRTGAAARLVAAILGLCATAAPLAAETRIDPEGPFRAGEGYADRPATCETIKDWIERAPATDSRITLTITGRLVAAQSDGTLAYLVMCEAEEVQVMCVTYSMEGRAVGDMVLFAGGYMRIGKRRIMLDPCLASPESQ